MTDQPYKHSSEFQTPPVVCNYMVSLMEKQNNKPWGTTFLEPTPGNGNLLGAADDAGYYGNYPLGDFWGFYKQELKRNATYHYVLMNPPFTPMNEVMDYVRAAMTLSTRIIALIPWLTVINSETRIKEMQMTGLKAITHLPRKTFPGSRIQTCIIELDENHPKDKPTIFKTFNW